MIIKAVTPSETIVLGDFNMDYNKLNDVNYSHANLFNDFNEVLSEKNLVQIIQFPTWSRLVGLVQKQSILDHVYLQDPGAITDLKHIKLWRS